MTLTGICWDYSERTVDCANIVLITAAKYFDEFAPSLEPVLPARQYLLYKSWIKPGLHYPSWRPELRARLDRWPVSITRQLGPLTRAVNSGGGNRALLTTLLTNTHTDRHTNNFFHLAYRSQIWTELNALTLIIRGFRCRCAFWGSRRQSIIFRGPDPPKPKFWA